MWFQFVRHLWVLFGVDFNDIVGLVWIRFCWVLFFNCGSYLVPIVVILLDWCGFVFVGFSWSFVGFVLAVMGDG